MYLFIKLLYLNVSFLIYKYIDTYMHIHTQLKNINLKFSHLIIDFRIKSIDPDIELAPTLSLF